MKRKVHIIILFSLLVSLTSVGQVLSSCDRKGKFTQLVVREYNYDIDASNYSSVFDIAKELVNLKDFDSTFKANKILWGLEFYDTLPYSIEMFRPLLAKMEKTRQEYRHHSIIGKWQFKR